MKQNHSGGVVGKPYLGIASHLPVIRPESGPDEPESKLKIDSWVGRFDWRRMVRPDSRGLYPAYRTDHIRTSANQAEAPIEGARSRR